MQTLLLFPARLRGREGMGAGLPTARRRPSFPPVSPLTSFSLSNLEWNGVKEKEEKEGEQQRPAAFVAAQEKGVDRKKRNAGEKALFFS